MKASQDLNNDELQNSGDNGAKRVLNWLFLGPRTYRWKVI